jgi:hypothetical protein
MSRGGASGCATAGGYQSRDCLPVKADATVAGPGTGPSLRASARRGVSSRPLPSLQRRRTKSAARAALGVRTVVDDAGVYDQVKLMARFVLLAGYAGLLICLDELDTLYKLSNTTARNANYEELQVVEKRDVTSEHVSHRLIANLRQTMPARSVGAERTSCSTISDQGRRSAGTVKQVPQGSLWDLLHTMPYNVVSFDDPYQHGPMWSDTEVVLVSVGEE